jgi:hypothetical protein
MTNVNGKEKPTTNKSTGQKVSDSGTTNDDTTGISKKDLKTLSKCESGAAADSDLTLTEVKYCYNQAFYQEQHKPDQSNSVQGNSNSQPENAQQQSSPLGEPKITSMREGFNF